MDEFLTGLLEALKESQDFRKQLDENKKRVFVPVATQYGFYYVEGIRFKYNDREIVSSTTPLFNEAVLIDPTYGIQKSDLVSIDESVQQVDYTLRLMTDDDYEDDRKDNREMLIKAQKQLGRLKPPTYYFDLDDSNAQKVWDKIKKEEKLNDFMD